MKHFPIIVVLSIMLGMMLFATTEKPTGKEFQLNEVAQNYFTDKEMLIPEELVHSCYFIRKDMPEDMRIIAWESGETYKKEFSTFDRVVINKGSQDGLHEGDKLLVIGKGKKIFNPFTNTWLGFLYWKKLSAEVVCVYDNSAIISLGKGSNAVNIGDFAIPFKSVKPIFEKRLKYNLCRIPENSPRDRVLWMLLENNNKKDSASSGDLVTIGLGADQVQYGTHMLIYKEIGKGLPPLILGTGIVVQAEETNSTMKIIDSVVPVEEGFYTVVLKQPEKPAAAVEKPAAGEGDKLPIVTPPATESTVLPGDRLDLDVYFPLDGSELPEDTAAQLAEIQTFISGKEYVVILRGYTCSIGGEEYNLRLAQARVEAVKNFLTSQFQVDAGRLETYYYGEKGAPCDNSSESERRKNRVVKIEVIRK